MRARASSSSKGDKISKKTNRYSGKTKNVIMRNTLCMEQQKINLAREINMPQF